LWDFTHFLDDKDDTTPHVIDFSISHEKQIVNYLLKYAKELTCEEAKFQNLENPKIQNALVPRLSG
jgi:hypothetical protein